MYIFLTVILLFLYITEVLCKFYIKSGVLLSCTSLGQRRIKLQWFTIINSHPGMKPKFDINLGLHTEMSKVHLNKLLVCTEKSVIFMETKHELL